jgi:hypothetical protein
VVFVSDFRKAAFDNSEFWKNTYALCCKVSSLFGLFLFDNMITGRLLLKIGLDAASFEFSFTC